VPDTKTSALPSGGSLQDTDQIPINRAGTNYRALVDFVTAKGRQTVTATMSQITANQNNYAMTAAAFVALSSDALREVTGIVAPAAAGETRILYNAGTQLILFKYESGSSTAANQIICPEGIDFALYPNTFVLIAYHSSRWRLSPLSAPKEVLTNTATMSGNLTLTYDYSGIYLFRDPNGANRDITLWATPRAGSHIYVKNIGSANNLVIKNSGGTEIITLPPGVATVLIADGNGDWQE
jgi:hypothetical protein